MNNVWDDYLDQNNIFWIEGKKGLEQLKKLIHDVDNKYKTLDQFLVDNQGAMQCLLEWIEEHVDESDNWENNLAKALIKD